MTSSLLRTARLRLADRLRRAREPAPRIDTAARVHPTAEVRWADLHGPVVVEERARIYRAEITGEVSVGRYSSLWGPEIYVHARIHPVTFGNFCSIARHVSVHGYYHDARRLSTHFIGRNLLGRPLEEEIVSRGPVRIGHDVWLGAGVQVMSGVGIGNGAIVGAGSVVTRDVPAYSVAVGAPAEVVRPRFDDALAERIEASEWWSWSEDEIRAREALFTQPVTEALLERWV